MYPWSTKSKIIIYVLSMVACALLFYLAHSSAKKRIDISFPTSEEKVDRFIDTRVDKILEIYGELLIETGFFYDKNGIKYKVVKDED